MFLTDTPTPAIIVHFTRRYTTFTGKHFYIQKKQHYIDILVLKITTHFNPSQICQHWKLKGI